MIGGEIEIRASAQFLRGSPAAFMSSSKQAMTREAMPAGTISFKLLAACRGGDACTKFAGVSRVLKGSVVLAPYPVMNFAIRLRE